MARQLSPEEIVTLLVLKERGQSNVQIAQALGISEGTVRYHARTADKPDGRRNKPRKADPLAEAIAHWIASSQPDKGDAPHRPANVHALRPRPARLAARRARLQRIVSLSPALRAGALSQASVAALPPCRDAAWRPGPG